MDRALDPKYRFPENAASHICLGIPSLSKLRILHYMLTLQEGIKKFLASQLETCQQTCPMPVRYSTLRDDSPGQAKQHVKALVAIVIQCQETS